VRQGVNYELRYRELELSFDFAAGVFARFPEDRKACELAEMLGDFAVAVRSLLNRWRDHGGELERIDPELLPCAIPLLLAYDREFPAIRFR
jgi:hypothetical protein